MALDLGLLGMERVLQEDDRALSTEEGGVKRTRARYLMLLSACKYGSLEGRAEGQGHGWQTRQRWSGEEEKTASTTGQSEAVQPGQERGNVRPIGGVGLEEEGEARAGHTQQEYARAVGPTEGLGRACDR